MTVELVQLENKIRRLRKRALGGTPKAELIGELTGVGIPAGAPFIVRQTLIRMLNETIALIGGAEFRPYSTGERLIPGQLVRLPESAWDHIGNEVDVDVFEVLVDGPDGAGDVAVTPPRDETYTVTDPHLEKIWVNARLFDVIDTDGHEPASSVAEDSPVDGFRSWYACGLRYPLTVADLQAVLRSENSDWLVTVAEDASGNGLRLTVTEPGAEG